MSVKHAIASLALLAGSVFGATVAADERAFDYVQVRVPGSVRTIAYGINAAGHVVGNYLGEDGVDGAFILRGEDYETFVIPDAVWTEARGIGPGGEVVGIYEKDGAWHGFRRSADGTVASIDYPGKKHTMLIKVSPAGEVVGCHHDDGFTNMNGFVLGSGGYRNYHVTDTMHNGISPDGGTIVGHQVGAPTQGYVITRGVPELFSVPFSLLTQAWDINAGREVVGVFRQANGTFRGFLRSKSGEFTTLEYPGSLHTRAFGINSAGDIVGLYVKDGRTSGFLISRSRRMN